MFYNVLKGKHSNCTVCPLFAFLDLLAAVALLKFMRFQSVQHSIGYSVSKMTFERVN